jgi:hypothetical protein
MMADSLRDRIADEDEKHYQMLATDGGWLCACGHRFSGNTYREWRLHKADMVIAELALELDDEEPPWQPTGWHRYITKWERNE